MPGLSATVSCLCSHWDNIYFNSTCRFRWSTLVSLFCLILLLKTNSSILSTLILHEFSFVCLGLFCLSIFSFIYLLLFHLFPTDTNQTGQTKKPKKKTWNTESYLRKLSNAFNRTCQIIFPLFGVIGCPWINRYPYDNEVIIRIDFYIQVQTWVFSLRYFRPQSIFGHS